MPIGRDLWHTAAMPKRLSTPDTKTKVTSSEISRVMAAMGRKGGKVGGKRRMVTMTPEQRREVAQHAAQARWGKSE